MRRRAIDTFRIEAFKMNVIEKLQNVVNLRARMDDERIELQSLGEVVGE